MNRRRLIQTMLATPVVAALGGCQRNKDYPTPPATPTPPARGGKLKVILNGPFVVVIDAKNHKIKAFVPYDDDGLHQLRFDTAKGPVVRYEAEGRKSHGFQFKLEAPGDVLEAADLPRHIDAGFADFRLRAQPREDDAFVAVDLPMPELITFIPPPVPVQFIKARLGMMPTNYVLEYQVRDFDKVNKVLMNTPLGPNAPLSCSDLLGEYEKHWDQRRGKGMESRQRGHIEAELYACEKSRLQSFFIGVGLAPDPKLFPGKAAFHARDFFNKLLSLFPKTPERDRMTLVEVDAKPCPTAGDYSNAPRLIPAVQRYTMPEPRLAPVAYVDDCRAGGVIAGP